MAAGTAVVVLLAAVAATQVSAEIEACKNWQPDQPRPKLYDLYKLTFHSRGAYCMLNPCDKLRKGQGYPHPPLSVKSLTTLHANGTEGPTWCMPVEYNSELVKSMNPTIAKVWPSFDRNVRDEALWEQQAREYGSCAMCQDRKMNGQILTYMTTVVNGYDVKAYVDKLDKMNLLQSNKEPVTLLELNEALEGGRLHDILVFDCKGQLNNTDILQEVSVCMDLDFNPVPCHPPTVETCRTDKVWFLGNLNAAMGLLSGNSLIVMLSTLLAYLVSKAHQ